MKYFRIAVVLLFVISLLLFGWYKSDKWLKTDSTIPVIEGKEQSIQVNCDYQTEELLKGLTAYDEKDGDLTDKIIVGNISHFKEPGKADITYLVFDSANQCGTYHREIVFKDYHAPRFLLSKPLVFAVDAQETPKSLQSLIGAMDVLDGDIGSNVEIDASKVNFAQVGTYFVKASVLNSYGDEVSYDLPLHVLEQNSSAPTIQLKENIVYIPVGKSFAPREAIDAVIGHAGQKLNTSLLEIRSNVNTNVPGVYEVQYIIDDVSTGFAETYLTVVVL